MGGQLDRAHGWIAGLAVASVPAAWMLPTTIQSSNSSSKCGVRADGSGFIQVFKVIVKFQ